MGKARGGVFRGGGTAHTCIYMYIDGDQRVYLQHFGSHLCLYRGFKNNPSIVDSLVLGFSGTTLGFAWRFMGTYTKGYRYCSCALVLSSRTGNI